MKIVLPSVNQNLDSMRSALLLILMLNMGFTMAQDHEVFQLGHSLVSPTLPAMLKTMGDSVEGVNHQYNYGVINGSPLFYTWDHAEDCQGFQASTVNCKDELSSGAYDVFVMTEGVPWDPILADFVAYADSFHRLAVNGNEDIQTYLYETWNCVNTGLPTGCMYDDGDTILWTTRIRSDLSTWELVADNLSARYPDANPVRIIPVGQAFANLKDSVDAGVVSGASDFYADFFSDDIHPNEVGYYFASLVHFAVIYQRTPVGLPRNTIGEWGNSFNAPSQQLALKLQEIVWETVCSYARTGVDCGQTTSAQDLQLQAHGIEIFPNPTSGEFVISGELSLYDMEVLDANGSVVNVLPSNGTEVSVDLDGLGAGLYFIRIRYRSDQNPGYPNLWIEKILKQ